MKEKILSLPLPIYFSVFSIVIITASFLISYQQLPPKLPLLYSLQWGEDQLVSRQQFLLLPSILIFINLVNILISWQLHIAHKFLKRLLVFNLIFVDLVTLTTAIKILMIFT